VLETTFHENVEGSFDALFLAAFPRSGLVAAKDSPGIRTHTEAEGIRGTCECDGVDIHTAGIPVLRIRKSCLVVDTERDGRPVRHIQYIQKEMHLAGQAFVGVRVLLGKEERRLGEAFPSEALSSQLALEK
jgi:hypothetical protein